MNVLKRLFVASPAADKKMPIIGSFYALSARDIDGKDVDFSTFTGKVCVVVNVASK